MCLSSDDGDVMLSTYSTENQTVKWAYRKLRHKATKLHCGASSLDWLNPAISSLVSAPGGAIVVLSIVERVRLIFVVTLVRRR